MERSKKQELLEELANLNRREAEIIELLTNDLASDAEVIHGNKNKKSQSKSPVKPKLYDKVKLADGHTGYIVAVDEEDKPLWIMSDAPFNVDVSWSAAQTSFVPEGWLIPSKDDFEDLKELLGGFFGTSKIEKERIGSILWSSSENRDREEFSGYGFDTETMKVREYAQEDDFDGSNCVPFKYLEHPELEIVQILG